VSSYPELPLSYLQLIPAMAGLVASGLFPAVLGSRILGGGALRGGMALPWTEYSGNLVFR